MNQEQQRSSEHGTSKMGARRLEEMDMLGPVDIARFRPAVNKSLEYFENAIVDATLDLVRALEQHYGIRRLNKHEKRESCQCACTAVWHALNRVEESGSHPTNEISAWRMGYYEDADVGDTVATADVGNKTKDGGIE